MVVSCASICEWGQHFDQPVAATLKRRRPTPDDKWHLYGVFVRIRGKLHDLWRVVDQDGHVLDILVQDRRNTEAAERFFRKLSQGLQHVPRVIVTDKPESRAAAKRRILPGVGIGKAGIPTTLTNGLGQMRPWCQAPGAGWSAPHALPSHQMTPNRTTRTHHPGSRQGSLKIAIDAAIPPFVTPSFT